MSNNGIGNGSGNGNDTSIDILSHSLRIHDTWCSIGILHQTAVVETTMLAFSLLLDGDVGVVRGSKAWALKLVLQRA